VPELARSLLLEARRDEGRRGVPAPLLLLDLGDGPGRAVEPAQDLVHARAGIEGELLAHLLPVGSARRATKIGGWPASSRGSTVQYSSGTKARISRSRSTMMRTATDCTRPADNPRRTFCQSSGESR